MFGDWNRRAQERMAAKARGPWQPGAGGTEKPTRTRSGRRVQYMFQPATGRHEYIDLDTDIFLTDDEAYREGLGEAPRSARPGLGNYEPGSPQEVQDIQTLMIQSAAQVGSSSNRVLITQSKDDRTWALSDAFGNVGLQLLYNGGWWMKYDYEPRPRRIEGDFSGAAQIAMRFFAPAED
jgi:hypothetical protein